MKKRFYNMSLNKKAKMVWGIMMLIMSVLCVFLYYYYYAVFYRTTINSFDAVINSNTEKVVNLVERIENTIDLVNDNESAFKREDSQNLSGIASWIINTEVATVHPEFYEFVNENGKKQNEFSNLFIAAMSDMEREMNAVLLIAEENPISAYLHEWGKDKKYAFVSAAGIDEEWYHQTIKKNGELYWFSREEYPGRLFCAKNLTYRDVDRNGNLEIRNLGVILVNCNVSGMLDNLRMTDVTAGTFTALGCDDGALFYDNIENENIDQDNLKQYAVKWKSGYQELNGTRYFVRKEDISGDLWMITAIPMYEMKQVIFHTVRLMLTILLANLILGVVMAFMLNRAVVKPVVELSEQMEKGVIEQIEEKYPKTDEIGMLYKQYNYMQTKIQELLEETWESAQMQKKAEVHALQMQINPHFVFNTLGTISSYAMLNGEDQIASLLAALSSIMRYNTRNPDALVPLREEIRIIRKYEKIQQVSYENKLNFHYDIAPECEEMLIPKLIIQPLVENAIVHGVDLKKGNGDITISAYMQLGGVLAIRVLDNGTGIDADRINQYIRGEDEVVKNSESLGVRNVYDRLRFIFGDFGDLRYRKNENGNTEAVISILMK